MTRNPNFAVQWFHNGDFPTENPDVEGTIVRYFRHPDYEGKTLCPVCDQTFHDHGFIDEGKGTMVCPGAIIYCFDHAEQVLQRPERYTRFLAVMQPENFKNIFGIDVLFSAQKLNGSFARGDTQDDIFNRHLKNDVLPAFRNYLNMRLTAMQCEGTVDFEELHMSSIGYNVGRLNLMIDAFWQIVFKTAKRRFHDSEIWYSSMYQDTQRKLDQYGYGVKLIAREEYHELQQKVRN